MVNSTVNRAPENHVIWDYDWKASDCFVDVDTDRIYIVLAISSSHITCIQFPGPDEEPGSDDDIPIVIDISRKETMTIQLADVHMTATVRS
jgi:hypothetical protein